MLGFLKGKVSNGSEKKGDDSAFNLDGYNTLIQNLSKGHPVNFGLFTYTPAPDFTPDCPRVTIDINKQAVTSRRSNGMLFYYNKQHERIRAEEVDAQSISAKKKEFKLSSCGTCYKETPSYTATQATFVKSRSIVTEEEDVTFQYEKTYKLK